MSKLKQGTVIAVLIQQRRYRCSTPNLWGWSIFNIWTKITQFLILRTSLWVWLLLTSHQQKQVVFRKNTIQSASSSTYCQGTVSVSFVYAVDILNTNSETEQRTQGSRRARGRALTNVKNIDNETSKKLTVKEIFYNAGRKGLGGGIPGAIAGVAQVLALMWIRTITSYQCRYGTSFTKALVILLNDGGIPRLYRGLPFALIQAPLARFVSTAANDGVQSLLSNLSWTQNWGPGLTTITASIVVGMGRIFLMPIDTMKTVLQVDSVAGFRSLMRRVRSGRFGALYEGALATAISAFVGHFPWFFTYNILANSILVAKMFPSLLLRNAIIGVAASIVSDTLVNAIRVVKTTKQAIGSQNSKSYAETVSIILAADGWKGLFGRGLQTRIFGNALQSILFTVIWRGLADRWNRREEERKNAK